MIKRFSPAKVNLHLTVFGKRPDGYHDIATLMQQIGLYDELTFSLQEQGIALACPGSPLPEDDNNIVYRAAEAFLAHISYTGGVAITLRKNIPLAAGLGGGSSNAATTLIALNEMTGGCCARVELLEIGRKLGADVPFFIYGPRAWALGVGDRLQEADPLPPLWFVLVNPGFPVSTKMVYEKLNLGLTKEKINYSIPRFRIGSPSGPAEGLKNDLEAVTLHLYPLLQQIKKLLLSCGALGALMSGSGPTVFGIFATEKRAQEAKERLARGGADDWMIYVARSL